ncbi:hypothetical protein BGY98DRAFT_991513, partial [Russula aff. rugulosa BPL654]
MQKAVEGDSGRGEFWKWPMSGRWQRVGMRGPGESNKHLDRYADGWPFERNEKDHGGSRWLFLRAKLEKGKVSCLVSCGPN